MNGNEKRKLAVLENAPPQHMKLAKELLSHPKNFSASQILQALNAIDKHGPKKGRHYRLRLPPMSSKHSLQPVFVMVRRSWAKTHRQTFRPPFMPSLQAPLTRRSIKRVRNRPRN
jgi:hypothetical protein